MPNDIDVTKNTTAGSERWDVTYTADQAGTVTKTMDTAGTLLDRDVKVSITTPAGSAATPATSITATPSISVNSSGLITASASASQNITPTVSAGFVTAGTAGAVTVTGSNTSQLSTQAGATIAPTESEQTAVAAGKYTTGAVNVGAISSTYVGSGITQRTSSDLSASGATVTAPAGYYPNAAAKTVTSGSATTPATTITPNAISISVNSSTGVITASNTQKTQSVTPTVSAGYVSSGTAGTITVSAASNTSNLTTQAAQTIHPSTSDQTISSGKYLTGTQTVKGVLLTNLTAENIADGVTVKVGDSTDDDCVTSITGTHSGGGGTPGLKILTPDYIGLSYGYVDSSGRFAKWTAKTNYISCYHLEAGKKYFVSSAGAVPDRDRKSLYIGLTFSDFEYWVNTPGSGTLYTTNYTYDLITNPTSTIFRVIAPGSDGELVALTSANSATLPVYCWGEP